MSQLSPNKKWIIYFLQGALIGGAGILPGISGGVLCLVFGIYLPLMKLLTSPSDALHEHMNLFVPFGAGTVFGFFVFARVVELLLNWSEVYTTWLFIGLIAGTLPSLFREAGKKGFYFDSGFSLFLGFIFMLVVLLVAKSDLIPPVEPSFMWFVFCGVLWGLSIVVPGMTSSSTLMALNLYEPLNSGISNMELSVLVPWGIGMVVTMLALAKLITILFDRFYSKAYHFIIGITLASTLIIVPLGCYTYFIEIIISIGLFLAGLYATYYLDKFTTGKIKK